MIYIADSAFVTFEPDIPATPVARDGIPLTQDLMGCAPPENVTDMSLSAKNMNPIIERNIKSTGNP